MNINQKVTPGRLELQEKMYDTLRREYPRIQKRLAFLFPQKPMLPNMFLTLKEIEENIKTLLDPALLTMINNDLLGMDLTSEIKSDYYDTMIGAHIDSITYTLFCSISDFLICSLLNYVSKEFVFEYIKNSIVKPNITQSMINVRNIILMKDKISQELEDSKTFHDMIETCVHDLMIKLDADKFLDNLHKILRYEVKDRELLISNVISNIKLFVPDFLKEIMINGSIDDFNHAKISKFLSEYTKAFSHSAVINIFRGYAVNTDSLKELTDITINERDVFHGINSLSALDGLTISENKLLSKIVRLQTLTEPESVLVDNNKVLRNAKSVIDKFRKYDDVVRVENGDIVIVKPDGNKKTFNIIKYDVMKDLSDPFSVFKKSKWVKKKFMTDRANSCLYQTGMTKDEERDLLLSGKGYSFQQSPEDKVFDRQRKIQKLLTKLSNDKEVMQEYERISSGRLDDLRYINETQSKPYVIEDEVRLLFTLAETEAIYKQIMVDIATKKE